MTETSADQQIRAVAVTAAFEHTKWWTRPASLAQVAEVADAIAQYIRTGTMGVAL